jgi:hypothetical protein
MRLTRYKVVVLNMKPRRHNPNPKFQDPPQVDDGALTMDREDVFFGYSYAKNYVGKHFDLWFTKYREWDQYNIMGFGRIVRIDPTPDGAVYITRAGRFFVKEII